MHDELRIFTGSEFNAVNDLVSRATDDGDIPHEQFIAINNEVKGLTVCKLASGYIRITC